MIRGQCRDLTTRCESGHSAALAEVNELKTRMLFTVAMPMRAVVSESDPATIEAITVVASHVGQAFQSQDNPEDGETAVNG